MDAPEIAGELAAALVRLHKAEGAEEAARTARACADVLTDIARDLEKLVREREKAGRR